MAGRKDKSGLSGRVLINGIKMPENFKRISGYVVQVSDCEVRFFFLNPVFGAWKLAPFLLSVLVKTRSIFMTNIKTIFAFKFVSK